MSGGSTDLITYLNYMSTWDSESDANIDALIAEQKLFVNLNDFNSDDAINQEFDRLHELACLVRDHTIAADSIQIAADAAAVAAIWSFGLGMAAFAALEAAELIEKKIISSKSKELNDKLKTVDTDISSKINDNVNQYVVKYKANNSLIASKAPAGLDTRACRANLMQFMATVQKKQPALTATIFRQYAASARVVFNSQEINKVYDALDELNFSGKTDADVKKFLDVLTDLTYPPEALTIVQNFAIAIMFFKLKIANDTIRTQAREAGIPLEEVDATAFEAMDAVGKFVTCVAVVLSVVDVVFQILDIVEVVKQCQQMCDELDGTIKTSYKAYFDGIKTASQQYRKAIGLDK